MTDTVRWTQTAVVAALREWAARYGEDGCGATRSVAQADGQIAVRLGSVVVVGQ